MKKIASSTKYLAASSILAALCIGAAVLTAQDTSPVPPPSGEAHPAQGAIKPAKAFDELADRAIGAMKKRAEELHIKGVGVVAYFEGESAESWSSKMVVVGSLKNNPSQNDPGVNLLAIAYSKAAEMADTLKNSGSGVRPPLKGEFGWQGGLIQKGKTGYLIASFSGGPSEDDLKVARTGLDILATKL
jgi:hypothetical protein